MRAEIQKLRELAEKYSEFANELKLTETVGHCFPVEYSDSEVRIFVTDCRKNSIDFRCISSLYYVKSISFRFYAGTSIEIDTALTDTELKKMHTLFSKHLTHLKKNKKDEILQENANKIREKYETLQAELSELEKQMK
jgi:hypothetical protein